MLCYTCGKRPRRTWRDSMCRVCRNEYNRIWKAKRQFGEDLVGYKPRMKDGPKVRIRGTPEVHCK